MGLNLLGIFPVTLKLFLEPLGGNIGFKDNFFLSTIHFSLVVSANIYIKNSDFFHHQFPVKRRGHGTERKELVIIVFTHGTEREELVIVVFTQADKNARGRIPPISR